MNLEKAIPNALKQAEVNKQIAEGLPLLMSEKHEVVDRLVSQYREQAKLRMIGSEDNPDGTYFDIEYIDGKPSVMQKNIESPELRRKIDEYKFNRKVAPVGEPLM